MTFIEGSTSSVILLLILIVLILVSLLLGVRKANPQLLLRSILILASWNFLSSLLVVSDLIVEQFLPFGVILFSLVNITAIVFAMGKIGTALSTLPVWLLVLFQSFRLPLELILHEWAGTGTIPSTMTWTGQNFDIATGVLALGATIPAFQKKAYFWIFNLVGILLLLNVIRVVLMSSPLPFAWQLENPIQLVAFWPYHFVGTVCVWSAVAGHIILTRRLLKAD